MRLHSEKKNYQENIHIAYFPFFENSLTFLYSYMIKHLATLLFLFSVYSAPAQWNENAGLIPSLLDHAKITASSGDNVQLLIDQNMDTYWESENPLPTNYLNQPLLNILRNQELFSVTPANTSLALALDGNTDTKSTIISKEVKVEFSNPENVSWLHVKIKTNDQVTITLFTNSQPQQLMFLPSENYQLKSIELDPKDPIVGLKLSCDSPYDLFELGMMAGNAVEFVAFDLGEPTKIGWVSTRHYNGDGVLSIQLLGSVDGQKWTVMATPQPHATAFIPVLFSPEITVRYIKLEFVLEAKPYQKARLMEIAAYDKYGPFGPPPAASPAKTTFGESMGINAFWGWGYSVYSDLLTAQQGPGLFNQVANLARNYHRIDWDIENPQQTADFNHHPKNGETSGPHWMNWDREYIKWKEAGFIIDASITFDKTTFSDKAWKNPEKEAYAYGNAFAKHFVNQENFISTIEIGNEPWEYSAQVYQAVLKGLGSGIKGVSPAVTILPCAVQAFDQGLSLNNYVSKYLTSETGHVIDGLNTHIYPYIFVADGKRRAINPEDPRSEVWSLNNLSRFRDTNMPEKVLAVTEYGYDSEGGGEDCTHDECVSEEEQAMYGTRMTLMISRLGANVFYWYFFANVDYISMLHNRSGLTASYSGGFEEKSAFFAFKKLKGQLGNLYFNKVVLENDLAYVYAFADGQGKIKKLIAWRPTSENHTKAMWIDIPFKASNIDTEFIVDTKSQSGQVPSYSLQTNAIRIALTGNPVIITVID